MGKLGDLAVEELFSHIFHELRRHLTLIVNYATILQEEDVSKERHDQLIQSILNHASEMNNEVIGNLMGKELSA